MAAVFTARDEQLGRVVALKVLAPALAADQQFRHRFIRESRAAAAVDDPHIIPLFEAGEAEGVLFIAMRYVPGGDVRSLLFREGPLPFDRTTSIISPVASALDAAHAAGLVHRDVKPANMLLDRHRGRPDHVYLSDFGLTKDTIGSSGLTSTGLFLGTADYAAPEQIDGSAVDGRADQYALACAAYEMLTGQPPFPRGQPLAVLAAHLRQQPPAISSVRHGIPASLDPVFSRALAKSPAGRYPRCGDFSEALRGAVGMARYDSAGSHVRPPTEQVLAVPVAAPGATDLSAKDTAAAARYQGGSGTAEIVGPGQRSRRHPAPPRRRSGKGWFIAATAVAGAAVIAVVLALTMIGGRRPDGAGVTASTTPSPSVTVYTDSSGFSVSLPSGWIVSSREATEVRFSGPQPGFVVVVAWSHHPLPDALADWRQQSAAKAAADPTYEKIRVRRVAYRGYNAADWEFTNVYHGVLTHVIDRTFIVTPGRLAYAVELSGPASHWAAAWPAIWPRVLSTFKPGR